MKKIYKLLFVAMLPVALISCGSAGAGSTVAASSRDSSKITLSGTVDTQSTGQTPGASPMANAVVHIVDFAGNEIATTTTDSNGFYSVQVSKLTDYGISVVPAAPVANGLVLKAVVLTGSANTTLRINPGTTAVAAVLEKKFGITLGNAKAPVGNALNQVNVPATVAAINSSPGFAPLANAVASAVASNSDPFTNPEVETDAQAVAGTVNVVAETNTSTAVSSSTGSDSGTASTGSTAESGAASTASSTTTESGTTTSTASSTTTEVVKVSEAGSTTTYASSNESGATPTTNH